MRPEFELGGEVKESGRQAQRQQVEKANSWGCVNTSNCKGSKGGAGGMAQASKQHGKAHSWGWM